MLEMTGDDISRNWPEIKALASRDDCGKNLIWLGSCEDELYVSRWLFKCLEEGIESTGCEHVNFINVNDAKPARGRCKTNCFQE